MPCILGHRQRRGDEGITNRTDGLADRELYTGLIRLHVLYHASLGPIYGLEMIEELRRHGYQLSPGTLYPLLHGLEKRGFLSATEERNGSSVRRVYRATRTGRAALKAAKAKVRELFGELFEEGSQTHSSRRLPVRHRLIRGKQERVTQRAKEKPSHVGDDQSG